jgi:hypothetical protein
LDDQAADFYATQKLSHLNDFTTLVQSVVKKDEQAHMERLTAAIENNADIPAAQRSSNASIFHNYESNAVVIYGKADITALRALTKDSNYKPIVLQNTNYGIVAVWLIDAQDTSVGAYKQCLITTVVFNKNLGYNLGVTYEADNDASLIFPAFGKLSEHARYYVLQSVTDQQVASQFHSTIMSTPITVQQGAAIETEDQQDGNTVIKFNFDLGKGEVLSGRVLQDNSWKSYMNTGYKIFKALGLSGILDLWHAPYVTIKTVGAQESKFSVMHANMKQHIHEWNMNTDEFKMGGVLKHIGFTPSMVIRMPLFQYAMMVPKSQEEDTEFNHPSEIQFVNPEVLNAVKK